MLGEDFKINSGLTVLHTNWRKHFMSKGILFLAVLLVTA